MLAALFFGIAISLAVLAYGYRSRLQQAGRQIAYLYGRLVESEKKAGEWKELAREAIHTTAKTAGLDKCANCGTLGAGYFCVNCHGVMPRHWAKQDISTHDSHAVEGPEATYVSPIVAFCSQCNVSVRYPPEAYPVKCPACETLIDPILDNPPEIEP